MQQTVPAGAEPRDAAPSAPRDAGPGASVRADTPGAFLVRRVLPVAILLPLGLAWARLRAEEAGAITAPMGAALFATALAAGAAGLVVWAARRVDESHERRLAAEAEGARSGHLLRAIADASPDAIFVKDLEGRYVFINRAGAAITGRTPEEVVGKDDVAITNASVAEKTREVDRSVVSEGAAHTYEVVVGPQTLSSTKAPLRDAGGRIVGVCGIARDITERKSAELALAAANHSLAERTAQVEAAHRELESFSYSVAHDLRAPLRSIDGFGQAFLEDYGDGLPAPAADHLRRMRAASQRMGQLIDDLLDLSRVSRAPLVPVAVDLSAVARGVAQELARAEPARAVTFDIPESLGATGDPKLLRVVLDNLLGNAWKFTSRREAARIAVGTSAQADGTHAYFVRDDGAGFDMQYADRLFGAFQRLHLASEFPGTGIGLATVQRVVHRHGGRVWAEGAPGAGATFWFTLGGARA